MQKKTVSGSLLTLLLLGTLTWAFGIQSVRASRTIYIRAYGSVEGTTDISTIDNVTYTFTNNIYDSIVVERDDIVVNGAGYTLEGTGSGTGIDLSYRDNVTIKNVEVTDFGYGIYLDASSDNVLVGNNVSRNSWGICLNFACMHNALANNNASGNGHSGILFRQYCKNNALTANTVLDNWCGVMMLADSSNNALTDNVASNNGRGFSLVSSSNNAFTGNVASDNGRGIEINGGSNNVLVGNSFSSNDGVGIYLPGSSYNVLIGNTVSNNDEGIYFYGAWSSNNIITGNNVSSNNCGIHLYASSNNRFCHNNFINNTQQVRIQAHASTDVWDDGYPSGGNYWSDHLTPDDYSGVNQDEPGSDGIVDEPYIIDDNNIDNYPFQDPDGWLKVHNVDTGENFGTIQEAIDDSDTLDGHTVLVDAGIYYEHVVVSKSLSIIGQDRETTIIDGKGISFAWVVDVTADNVEINGFTIQNGWVGISLDSSSGNTITNNKITSCERFGIWLLYSGRNHLRNNDMFDNVYNFGVEGSSLSDFIQDIDSSNMVDGKPIVYWVNQHNRHVPTNAGYVAAINSTHIDVRDLNLVNNLQGVLFAYTNDSIIERVNISNNFDGLCLFSSSDNVVRKNVISNIYCEGVNIAFSHGNLISDNVVTFSNGIRLEQSTESIISHNTLSDNSEVVRLYDSNDNIISSNVITSNKWNGIQLSQSNDNIICYNTISNNSYGIYLWRSGGNQIMENTMLDNEVGVYLAIASSNTFFHNNFVHNTKQVDGPWWIPLPPSTNTWDDGYPSGGNYWSDHVTVDDYSGINQDEPGSDGIVDEPYVIDDFNRDHYPLVEPWSPAISATVDIAPDTLHLMSTGQWVTCYIELPEGYNVSDIDVSTIMLNDTIPVALLGVPAPHPVPTEIGDYDNDTIPDLMVKFNRTAVSAFILSQRITNGVVTLTITGDVNGTPFEGTDTIRVLMGGGGTGRRK